MTRYQTNTPRDPSIFEVAYYIEMFPGLRQPSWKVIGPASLDYNCVAWTLGLKNVELGEDTDPFPLWGVDEFYLDAFGYSLVNQEQPFQPYDVLAIGTSPTEVKHVTVFLDVDGVGPTWTSKLGAGLLITHNAEQLLGGEYGSYMCRWYTTNGVMPVFQGAGNEADMTSRWHRRFGSGPALAPPPRGLPIPAR